MDRNEKHKELLAMAAAAPAVTKEDMDREDAETFAEAKRLGVEIPEIATATDSPKEYARKIAKNAAIAARKALRTKPKG